MDLFPVGSFVRLRSRERGRYVHADEDAIHVSLRALDAATSLNTVWKVDRWSVLGGEVLLFQGAAYGRYLALANLDEAPRTGHLGVRAVQRDYDSVNLDRRFAWRAARVDPGQNYVRLFNDRHYLRANGKHRFWNNLVTAGVRTGSTMMQWWVEAIPEAAEPLPLPPPPPPQPQPPIHVRLGLFRRRNAQNVHQLPGRTIWYARVDDNGEYVGDYWREFVSYDNSVANLRTQVAQLEGIEAENITLGVLAGTNALVIPLVTDLPNNRETMQIIVYTTGSPVAGQLRYPQV